MTRINMVPPAELMDQHLTAELYEMPRIPKAAGHAIGCAHPDKLIARIPPTYRMGQGHMLFFYDKGAFIQKRFAALLAEALDRWPRTEEAVAWVLDYEGRYDSIHPRFMLDYEPTPEALAISRERIAEKIIARPQNFTMRGEAHECVYCEKEMST